MSASVGRKKKKKKKGKKKSTVALRGEGVVHDGVGKQSA